LARGAGFFALAAEVSQVKTREKREIGKKIKEKKKKKKEEKRRERLP
jgi:hypothetical protein